MESEPFYEAYRFGTNEWVDGPLPFTWLFKEMEILIYREAKIRDRCIVFYDAPDAFGQVHVAWCAIGQTMGPVPYLYTLSPSEGQMLVLKREDWEVKERERKSRRSRAKVK